MKNSKIYKYLTKKFRFILCKTSPRLASIRIYNRTHDKKINLKNPKLFNEKLVYLKLKNINNDLIVKCADKVEVRNYVIENGYEDILNDVIGIYNNPDEIDWEKLPNKFAIKCNHGCGYNIICKNKKELNEKDVKNQLRMWMKENFGYDTAEVHYLKIPRRIICEKYIDIGNGKLPTDYKFYCFNGKAKLVLIMNDREEEITKEFYDLNWNLLHLRDGEKKPKTLTKKPKNLDYMITCAEKLAEPFEFVRVDFYDINNKLIFGELTFTPAACNGKYTPEADKMLGDMLEINKNEEKI